MGLAYTVLIQRFCSESHPLSPHPSGIHLACTRNCSDQTSKQISKPSTRKKKRFEV
jgi:hypothetical protein